MRFPSLNHIWQETVAVILRYPIEIVTAFAGSGIAIQLTYRNTDDIENLLQRLLMTVAIALPAFLAVTIWSRFRVAGIAKTAIGYILVLAALLLFFFTLNRDIQEKDAMRFFLLDITAHLMVASAGFIGHGSTSTFWQYNKHLFLRIITGAIFSGVLYAGLAGAILSMDALFNLGINGDIYGQMGIWIAGVFNTVFFLAGVPANYKELEQDHTYPKVLKVFTQFVLVPLVAIYLLILLAYEGKIIVKWELPNGWVSNLIIAYGIAGILSILLVYPIRHMEGNKWISFFSRWFYLLLMPLVVLMFVAIGVRIGDYGLTEPRVFVLVLAIWLAAISLYFLARSEGDIRVIPISLALLALLISAGPFSAFQISKKSQRARLEQLLQRNHLLQNGKLAQASKDHPVFFEERRNISSTIEYLLEHHGKESIEPWFATDSLSNDKYRRWDNTREVLEQLNMEYVSAWDRDSVTNVSSHYHNYTVSGYPLDISGYDTYFQLSSDGAGHTIRPDTISLHVRYSGGGIFAVYRDSEKLTYFIDPRKLMKQLEEKYGSRDDVGAGEMQIKAMGQGCEILVVFDQLRGHTDAHSISYSGAIFIKWK